MRRDSWWLDEAALPDLIWAVLRVAQDGPTVRDCDGRLHLFETRAAAESWLSEEGYTRLEDLIADRLVAEGTCPPDGFSGA